MNLCVVLLMEATTSPLVSQVTSDWLLRCASACAIQLTRDVAPIYGGQYEVRVGSGPSDVNPGEMVFAVVDALPDAPGAIAYHDSTGAAVPVGFLALSTCNTLDDVSTAVSHELVEVACDEECNAWRDSGDGFEYAQEACDPVQENSYSVDIGDGGAPIRVSDWVLPAFWAPGAAAPFCFMQMSSAEPGSFPPSPFATTPGGYQLRRNSGSEETQVMGSLGRRTERARNWSSRTHRRGARV